MEKHLSAHAKKTLALGKGLQFLFWGGIFLIVDFRLNDFDILHDFAGHLLAIAGALYLISGASLLEKTTKIFTWIVAVIVFVNFVASIVNFLVQDLVHPLWVVFVNTLFPFFILSLAYVGYGISKKLVKSLEKKWKVLLYIYIVIALILFAIPVAFTVALPYMFEEGTSFTGSIELNPVLGIAVFIILPVVIAIYSFVIIGRTSKELRKSVK